LIVVAIGISCRRRIFRRFVFVGHDWNRAVFGDWLIDGLAEKRVEIEVRVTSV